MLTVKQAWIRNLFVQNKVEITRTKGIGIIMNMLISDQINEIINELHG